MEDTFRVAGGVLLLIVVRSGGCGAGGGATLPFDCVWDVAAFQVPAAGTYFCYYAYETPFEHLLISADDMVGLLLYVFGLN